MHTSLYDTILQGDVLSVLRTLPDGCVQTCVTSPPYWGLRDYGLPPTVWDGDAACAHQWGETILAGEGYSSGNRRKWQHKATRDEHAEGWQKQTAQGEFCQQCGAWRGCLGLEPTPQLYVQHMVAIFAEVRRVLRSDGTAWVNLGDSYFGDSPARKKSSEAFSATWDASQTRSRGGNRRSAARVGGLKPKDLCGIPWMVAFALRDDGWYLRSDIVWAKSNPMPESVTDRPTKSHEYIFLLSKSQRYYYDADAIRESNSSPQQLAHNHRYAKEYTKHSARAATTGQPGNVNNIGIHSRPGGVGRNKRSVWSVATAPFSDWAETVHRVHVPSHAAGDDTKRITSADCPLHGDHPVQVPTVQCGQHAADASSHTICSDAHLLPMPASDCAPTGQHHAADSAGESSDLTLQLCEPSATRRNKRSRRTAHGSATTQPYTPSDGMAAHTVYTSTPPGSADSAEHTSANNSALADSDDHLSARTLHHTASMSSSSSPAVCSCTYYNEIAEKTSHFATFPPKLITPCILAGCPAGGIVLDPFMGSGSTGYTARLHSRHYLGIELNEQYIEMAERRIATARQPHLWTA